MLDFAPSLLAVPSLAALPLTFDDALHGDHAMGDNALLLRPERLTPAAVLVPVVTHAAEPTILLTQRQDRLRRHSGQVAFPGGRIDPEDTDPAAAALREAHEEIGLAPDQVRVIGALTTYITGTGFSVAPVVGLVHPGFTPVPAPDEVADVFEVPLRLVLDRAAFQRESAVFNGVERSFWAMRYADRYIWGATAGMLRELARRVAP